MKELMIEMIKNTVQYTNGLKYVETHNGINLYDDCHLGVFYSPKLAAMYEAVGFNTLCHYNESEKRVELKIFY